MRRTDFALTPSQRADARTALLLLDGSGLSLAQAARIATKGKQPARKISVADMFAEFVAATVARNVRPSTVGFYEVGLRAFALDYGAREVAEITRPTLRDWLAARPAGTRGNYFRPLRAAFRWAARQEPPLAPADLFSGLAFPVARAERTIDFLSVEDCARLLEASSRHRAAIALALFAGIRPEEIHGANKPPLQWASINAAERMVRVPAEIAKTRKPRNMEGLPDALWHWLASCRRSGESVSASRFRAVSSWAREILGLKRWPADIMRHTFATYAVALTEDAGKVSLWLGHEGATAILYRHYRGLATKAEAVRFFGLRP